MPREPASPSRRSPRSGRRQIFVSYRREDDGWALTITDALREHFGASRVFQDVDSIDAGTDFVDRIEEALENSGAMVAIVGKDWLQLGPEGNKGIHNPDDFVRIELATALKQGVKIVPVLLGNAQMPPASTLPADIAPFGRLEAKRVIRDYWKQDVATLAKTLEASVGRPTPPRARSRSAPEAAATTEQAPPQPIAPTAASGFASFNAEARAQMEAYQKSPEAQERRARAAAREAEKEAARRASPKFAELPAWWLSMILIAVACVVTAQIADGPVVWLSSLVGSADALPSIDPSWPIFLVALGWAAAYVKSGTDAYMDDPRLGSSAFITFGLLGGWTLLGRDEKRAAITSAFPLSIFVAWGLARAVGQLLNQSFGWNSYPPAAIVLLAYSLIVIRNYRNTSQVFSHL